MAWKQTAAGWLGPILLRLWRLTWRVDEAPRREVARRLGAGLPAVWLMWHSSILMGAATQAGQGLGVLISMHGDGEVIARIVRRMGFLPIRGSSTRGGREALRAAVTTLREGGHVAFTPDGPRGPRMSVQAGCVVAAMRAGVPIIPVGFAARRSKRLRSWDRFVVPLPFTRVVVRCGEPLEIPGDLNAAEVDVWRDRVRDALVAAGAEAARAAGAPIETPDVDPLTGAAHP